MAHLSAFALSFVAMNLLWSPFAAAERFTAGEENVRCLKKAQVRLPGTNKVIQGWKNVLSCSCADAKEAANFGKSLRPSNLIGQASLQMCNECHARQGFCVTLHAFALDVMLQVPPTLSTLHTRCHCELKLRSINNCNLSGQKMLITRVETSTLSHFDRQGMEIGTDEAMQKIDLRGCSV